MRTCSRKPGKRSPSRWPATWWPLNPILILLLLGIQGPTFGSLDWYDEFDRPLGEPLGDAVQDGWEYTREFEHVKVWVNINTKEAKIEWEGLHALIRSG